MTKSVPKYVICMQYGHDLVASRENCGPCNYLSKCTGKERENCGPIEGYHWVPERKQGVLLRIGRRRIG
ncbi:MAG: hypothetical protein QXY45_03255 [Candidatus Aenigmatarchaeota archaeon]